jgi:glycosyltransferase involved in cell wall biosynthesis
VARDLDDAHRDIDVLYVGQLYRWKGVDTLIRAMRELPGRRLEIVGGNGLADTNRVLDLIRSQGLEDRVHLHGYVSPPAVRAAISLSLIAALIRRRVDSR